MYVSKNNAVDVLRALVAACHRWPSSSAFWKRKVKVLDGLLLLSPFIWGLFRVAQSALCYFFPPFIAFANMRNLKKKKIKRKDNKIQKAKTFNLFVGNSLLGVTAVDLELNGKVFQAVFQPKHVWEDRRGEEKVDGWDKW